MHHSTFSIPEALYFHLVLNHGLSQDNQEALFIILED